MNHVRTAIQKLLITAAILLVLAGPVAGKALADWSWGGGNGDSGYSDSWGSYFGW